MVIFSSAAWDFTYGAIRILIYMLFAVLLFDVTFSLNSPSALALGIILTLLSSAGIGILSASFILFFKRGNPINFLLSGTTTFFGNVFFPVEQLPESIQWVSDFLPVTWSMRIIRGVLLQGMSFADVQGELGRLAVLTIILVPLGVFASRLAIRNAKREGSLIQY